MTDSDIKGIVSQFKRRFILTIIIGIMMFLVILGSIFLCYQGKRKESSSLKPGVPSSVPNVATPGVLYNLAGKIEKLEEGVIIFEAIVPQIDERNQLLSKKETRRAIVTSNTGFSRLIIATQQESGAETSKENQIDFKDLKIGDYIEVISSQNISQAMEFEATKIRALPF
jgi:hypothetical protein